MKNTETQTTTLRKGDSAYLFFSWDNKGTFAWYPYVIDSIGRQQIHLRSDDGEMLKRRIYPGTSNQYLVAASEVDNPEATAIEYAKRFLIEETARIEQRLATAKANGFGGAGYLRNVSDSLAVIRTAAPAQIKKRF